MGLRHPEELNSCRRRYVHSAKLIFSDGEWSCCFLWHSMLRLGVNFSAYYILAGAIETEFGTRRALAPSAVPCATPYFGATLAYCRHAHAAISDQGADDGRHLDGRSKHLLIAHKHFIYAMLICYALLIGLFLSCWVTPRTCLISNWFVEQRPSEGYDL
ncbi:hypothetical protein D3C85_721730 [compost metagenome]